MLLLLIISLVSCCLRSINLIVVGSISGDWNRSKFMFVTLLYHQVLLQKTATNQGPSACRSKSSLGNFSGFQLTLAMKNSFEICLNYRCVDQIEYTLLQVFQIQFLTFPRWGRFSSTVSVCITILRRFFGPYFVKPVFGEHRPFWSFNEFSKTSLKLYLRALTFGRKLLWQLILLYYATWLGNYLRFEGHYFKRSL